MKNTLRTATSVAATLLLTTAVVLPSYMAFAQEPSDSAPRITGGAITTFFRGDNAMERGAVVDRIRSTRAPGNSWGRRNVANTAGNVAVGSILVPTTEWVHTYAICPAGLNLVNVAPQIVERALGPTIDFIGRPMDGEDRGYIAVAHSEGFALPEVKILRMATINIMIGGMNVRQWGAVVRFRPLRGTTSHLINFGTINPWSYNHVQPEWELPFERFVPVCSNAPAGGAGAGVSLDELACMTGGPANLCGNMTCDEGENSLTCPDDCPAPDNCPSDTIPAYTTSNTTLINNNHIPHPKKISLTHHNILFLNKFPKFPHFIIESLHQPLKNKIITISHTQKTISFPTHFILITNQNPYPYNYISNPNQQYSYATTQINQYQKKLNKPLLNHINLHIKIPQITFNKLTTKKLTKPSSTN
jgi:hypothetical protein